MPETHKKQESFLSSLMKYSVATYLGFLISGAALVVNPKLNIKVPADFKGKTIGTPQLGNTQDVACRAWLIDNGIPVTLTSGEARVLATSNPEQLPLFKQGLELAKGIGQTGRARDDHFPGLGRRRASRQPEAEQPGRQTHLPRKHETCPAHCNAP